MATKERSISPLLVVGIGALALFGLISVVQWVIGAVFGVIKLAILVALAVVVIGAVLNRKAPD